MSYFYALIIIIIFGSLLASIFFYVGARKEKILNRKELVRNLICMRTFVESIDDDDEDPFIWSGVFYISREGKDYFINQHTYESKYYKCYVEESCIPTINELDKLIDKTTNEISRLEGLIEKQNELLNFYRNEKSEILKEEGDED